jgi:hypothetical protein
MGVREQSSLEPGDAPPQVRFGVKLALKGLQDGYTKRDVNNLDSFMAGLFSKDEDVLILGTDSGEWVHGYTSATGFIKGDWQSWGDLRIAVDDAEVWSSGDVAWIATVGDVRWKSADRPMRLTAVLVRRGDHWLFRELHFQWDDRAPGFRDLFRPQSLHQLISWMYQRIAGGKSRSSGF